MELSDQQQLITLANSRSKQAAVTILKNIFQFLQILCRASSKQVTQWDETSVRNAINWGLYCEEIYHHVHGQECEGSLAAQLSQMTFLLRPATCLNINVECLQNATILLAETLLANPQSTPVIHKALQNGLNSLRYDEGSWTMVKERIESSVDSLKTLQDVIFSVMPKQMAKAVLQESSLRCDSESLLTNLNRILSNAKDLRRFQAFCDSICESILSEHRRWDLLIHSVSLNHNFFSTDESPDFEQVKSCILFSMTNYSEKSSIVCPLWEIGREILRQAFIYGGVEFIRFYTFTLDHWANLFEPSFHGGNGFQWRTSSNQTAMDVANQLRGLILSQDPSLEYIQYLTKFITAKVKDSDFTVWQAIAQLLSSSSY